MTRQVQYLGLLEPSSVADVVDVVDGCRVFAAGAARLQLQVLDDLLEPRVLQTHMVTTC